MTRSPASTATALLFLAMLLPQVNAQDLAADARAVDARSHAWVKAALAGDANAFRTFATDGYLLLYVEPKTAASPAHWVSRTRDQWVEEIRTGQVRYLAVELRNTTVHINGDLALFKGEYTEKGLRRGAAYTETGFFVETWVKREGQWFAVSSVFP